MKSGRIVAHKNTQLKFFHMTNSKQTVNFTNERQPNSPEHEIARDDRAVKLGCSD